MNRHHNRDGRPHRAAVSLCCDDTPPVKSLCVVHTRYACREFVSGRLMPKTLTPQPTAAATVAGGFLISTVQAAEMTRQTKVETTTDNSPTTAAKPRDHRADTAETRIIKALFEARRARHHRECQCRRFDGQWCNATEALWARAMNRDLVQMRDHDE